ncbi:MAG: response regulator [Proteobacteria bacterium]|nr:response regulator [Pseudomonadota bacterium]MBU1738528.1 response regulator [Pseudomonadota bacterium]
MTMAEAARDRSRPLMKLETSGCRVLIVDDEPSIRLILSSILENEGYQISEIDSGAKAISEIDNIRPDLVLLDVMMPGINGFEVCRMIRDNQDFQEIPIIFITALTQTKDLVEAFEAGANDYLTKPFNDSEVRVRVKNHLRLKKAGDKLKRYSSDLEKIVEEEAHELIKAERQAAFGQLIQGIIHNLKGPLTAISAGLQIARFSLKTADFAETDDQAISFCQTIGQSMEMIDSGAARLTGMINSMMSRSRAENSGSFVMTDLNKIVEDELRFLNADLTFKNKFKKNIRLADKPLTVKAIPSELAQVVSNLISNAIDALHNHPAPAISIETSSRGNNVYLALSDNGPGIPVENIDHVFDPLFTTKAKAGNDPVDANTPTGTGLGLYTCMRIIRSHQGNISVHNNPGGGTTFQVHLPMQ